LHLLHIANKRRRILSLFKEHDDFGFHARSPACFFKGNKINKNYARLKTLDFPNLWDEGALN